MATALPTALPTDLVNADQARSRYGAAGQFWLDAMWSADPLADAVARDDFSGSSATGAVRAALVDGIDSVAEAPDSLRELFDFLDDEPEWVDHARLDHAADVLVRHTAALGIVLGAASLVRGAGNTIAGKPLALTGRYTSMPAIRSVEVGEWLRAVLTPGGMRRGGDGFAYTVRVRVIHAHVRHGLSSQDLWDHQSWGVPIPQPYMAFTIAEFGHIALEAMHKVGVRLTDHELGDIYHLWRYVGHVIGVDPRINPHDEADHIRIEELYRLTSPGPGDDDRDFVTALTYDYLVPELANLMPGPDRVSRQVAGRLMESLSRVFIGDVAADDLGIPDGRLKYVLGAMNPLLALGGRVRVVLAGGRDNLTRRGYRQRDEEMTRMRTDYRVTHDLVDAAPDTNGGYAT